MSKNIPTKKTPQTKYLRGQIYQLEPSDTTPTIGSETWDGRPVLIISNDTNNTNNNTVTIVPLSLSKKPTLPTHITITSGSRKAVAIIEQLKTVDTSRLTDYIGKIPNTEQPLIDGAISLHLNLLKPNTTGKNIFYKWEQIMKLHNISFNDNTDVTSLTNEIQRLTNEVNKYKRIVNSIKQYLKNTDT